jgi:hypothetical protein
VANSGHRCDDAIVFVAQLISTGFGDGANVGIIRISF